MLDISSAQTTCIANNVLIEEQFKILHNIRIFICFLFLRSNAAIIILCFTLVLYVISSPVRFIAVNIKHTIFIDFFCIF